MYVMYDVQVVKAHFLLTSYSQDKQATSFINYRCRRPQSNRPIPSNNLLIM